MLAPLEALYAKEEMVQRSSNRILLSSISWLLTALDPADVVAMMAGMCVCVTILIATSALYGVSWIIHVGIWNEGCILLCAVFAYPFNVQ